MFLRSVRLQHWACHGALDLELGPGLNVVVGPNGAGKSTLCGAIIAALTVKHSSKDREVRLLEPWGVEGCGPTVALGIARDGGEWRLSKTYVHEPTARLERREAAGWALRHKGKAVEEELARWLDADGAAGRLLLELWSPQVDPTRLFEAPGKNGKLSPSSLLGAGLADRLRAAEATGPFATARRLVAEQVSRSFTPVNRQVRVGSELQQAELDLRAAEQRWLDLSTRQEELARLVEEYRRLELAFGGDCRERDRLSEEAARRLAARDAYQQRLAALRDAEAELRRLQEAYDRADRDHRRLLVAAEERLATEERLAAIEPRVTERRGELDRAEVALRKAEQRRAAVVSHLDHLAGLLDRLNRLDDAARAADERLDAEREAAAGLAHAEAARDAAAGAVAAAREALQRAEADHLDARRASLAAAVLEAEARASALRDRIRRADRARMRADREAIDSTLARVGPLLAERASLDPGPNSLPVPSDDELQRLRTQSAALDARAAALESDAFTLRFEADRPLSVRIERDGSGAAEPAQIGPGETVDASAIGSATLELVGIGHVRVTRASSTPEERRRALESDRRAWDDRLRALGAASLAELEARRRAADRRAAIEAELAALLGGQTPESLRRRRDELEGTIGPAPIDPDEPPDPTPVDRLRSEAEAAERALAIAKDRLEAVGGVSTSDRTPDPAEAERRVVEARRTLAEADRALSAAGVAVDRARDRHVGAKARLDDAQRALSDEGGDAPDAASDLRLRISSIRHELIVWDADPPGATGQAVRLRRQAVEDDVEAKRRSRDDLAARLAEVDHALAAVRADADAARRRLDELIEQSDEGAPAAVDRANRLDAIRRDRDRAEARVALLRDQLGPDPTADDEAFADRRAGVSERCRLGEQELAVRLRELELLGGDGLDTRLALAAEELDDRRSRFDRLERDAAAWRLLDRVLGEVEADFARDVARQVEALSERWVGRLTGRNVRSVTLDPESLSPVSARPGVGASDLARALGHFSRGTREQVALACRLQLGALLAQDARQMILLDDPLAHTDARRHGEALDLLAEVADLLQVVVFSCHRDRYARLWESRGARLLAVEPAPAESVPTRADREAVAGR